MLRNGLSYVLKTGVVGITVNKVGLLCFENMVNSFFNLKRRLNGRVSERIVVYVFRTVYSGKFFSFFKHGTDSRAAVYQFKHLI